MLTTSNSAISRITMPTPPSFWIIIVKLFTNSINRPIDDQLGISAPCRWGLSSRSRLNQQQEGVQGSFGPLSIGYLQAGVFAMAPTAVGLMSSWWFGLLFWRTEQIKFKKSRMCRKANKCIARLREYKLNNYCKSTIIEWKWKRLARCGNPTHVSFDVTWNWIQDLIGRVAHVRAPYHPLNTDWALDPRKLLRLITFTKWWNHGRKIKILSK